MNAIDRKLLELGIELPKPSPPMAALLRPTRFLGDRLLVSGQTPKLDGKLRYIGKVGETFDLSEAEAATRLCMVNVLAHARAALDGNLSRVRAVVSVRGYINSDPDFCELAEVLNGASKMLLDLFGDEVGSHARVAIGAASMPFNVAAEVEAEFWVN